MKIDTLKTKIKNTEANIEKTTKTLEYHNKSLTNKTRLLKAQGVTLDNYNKYDREKISIDLYWKVCEYEAALSDVNKTTKKLEDYKQKLTELTEQLAKQLAKDTELENLIPESLNIFLDTWRGKCYNFYVDLAANYIGLVNKPSEAYEITKEELEKLTESSYNPKTGYREEVRIYTDAEIAAILADKTYTAKRQIKASIRNRHIKDFVKSKYASDMCIVFKITTSPGSDYIDLDLLNKILDEDVKLKREMFIQRIHKVIGDIKDLKGLKISPLGELNGIAIGSKCNAKVQTIGAGGYNIQCWHFRVLVNSIK